MGTNAEHAAALVRAIEASVTGDVSEIEELFAPDVHGSSPVLSVSSREELAIELEERDDAFSEIELAVDPLDVNGSQACVEWVAAATHSGPVGLDTGQVAIEPTGRRVTLRGITVAEFDGDRIASFRHYWDDVALLEGLGLLDVD
jgi:ketosteroid isomerase-like protein